MYKLQYAYQHGTGQTYKRTLWNNDGRWTLHPSKGAWKLVPIEEEHPFANTLDVYMRSLGNKAVERFDEELGQVKLAETQAFSGTTSATRSTLEEHYEKRQAIDFTPLYATTHGASVRQKPQEKSFSGEIEQVEVNGHVPSTKEEAKGLVSELGLTENQKKRGKGILILSGIALAAYGVYHFFFKPTNA